VIAVWGPAGAPGRTTLATALAAEIARRRLRTVLVDADPYAGAVAQQLGILDEVSGLLSAARLAAAGQLAERFPSVQRALDQHLTVVTGLPRADRWVEVRPGALEHLLEVAREQGHVVVDTGFSLEDDPAADFGSRPARNQMTLAALDLADEVVVVGSADPVGLSRLARALVDLRDLTGGTPARVVVNRMRPTLGWSEKEIAGMVVGFARVSGLHFLPEDRATVDRALVAGRTLPETGDSALVRGVAEVVDALLPEAAGGPVRPRTTGTARPR
jgi:MinD-like ATPase involved in chromosome partitioning or flagellar assembly